MDVKPSSANISGAEVAILYSCGVQALLVKQHDLAHDCFQVKNLPVITLLETHISTHQQAYSILSHLERPQGLHMHRV